VPEDGCDEVRLPRRGNELAGGPGSAMIDLIGCISDEGGGLHCPWCGGIEEKTVLDASAAVLWTNPLDSEESIESI
jgi:hypothetical protein